MKTCVAVFALLAVALACGPKKSEPPKPKEEKPAPWNMALLTDPAKPAMNKDVLFRLIMTDKQGQPVAGADVRASLVMPLMDMGKKEFALADKGRGTYEGRGKMDMAGPWDVVILAKAAGLEGQKTFSIRVEE